jgi:pyruvate/2-oxoglutarate dehydrogenase complex dihydrolipoamide acyltransferase (E2) component
VLLAACFLGSLALGAGPAAARPAQDATTTIPGTATTVAGSVTTLPAATTTSSVPATSTTTSSRVADENRKIWLVVGGLILVALALAALTVRYWRQTKPSLLPLDAEPAPRRATRADRKAAAAVATTAAAAEARADDTVAIPVAEPAAVPAADHRTSDEEWEPRGTGEHDRIEIPAARKPVKPTREERAAVLAAYRTGR